MLSLLLILEYLTLTLKEETMDKNRFAVALGTIIVGVVIAVVIFGVISIVGPLIS